MDILSKFKFKHINTFLSIALVQKFILNNNKYSSEIMIDVSNYY